MPLAFCSVAAYANSSAEFGRVSMAVCIPAVAPLPSDTIVSRSVDTTTGRSM